MQHMDPCEMHGEKATLEQHNGSTHCFKQTLETACHSATAAVQPSASHLRN